VKTKIACYIAVVAAICTPAWAQQKEISEGLVSTGRVLEISKDTGDVTLRSQQAANLVFRGLRAAPVYFSTGRRASFADIEPGQPATIYYAAAGGRWVIAKVVIPDPQRTQRSSQAATPIQPVPSHTRRGVFRVPRVPNSVW
jgi:hypothetical protein